MRHDRQGRFSLVLAALALACALCAAPARADEAAVQAVWTQKKLLFTYMGFTARYSCDGLRDKVKRTLLDLGARASDLKLTYTGCSSGYGRPSPFPGVAITAQVLEPVGEKGPPPDATVVSAHWKNVVIAPKGDPLAAAGDCELTEQLKQRILPLFTTRNVVYSSTCVPNQLTVGGTKLSTDVLIADPPGPKAPAAGSP